MDIIHFTIIADIVASPFFLVCLGSLAGLTATLTPIRSRQWRHRQKAISKP